MTARSLCTPMKLNITRKRYMKYCLCLVMPLFAAAFTPAGAAEDAVEQTGSALAPLSQLEETRAAIEDRQRSLASLITLAEQLEALAGFNPALMSLLDGNIDTNKIKQVVSAMSRRSSAAAAKPSPAAAKPFAPGRQHLLYAQAADARHNLEARAVIRPANTPYTLQLGQPRNAPGGLWQLEAVTRLPGPGNRLLVTLLVNNQRLNIEYPH